MKKNPLVQNQPNFRLDTMYRAEKDALKNPPIGVTQGGSSRKNSGAKSAAKQTPPRRKAT